MSPRTYDVINLVVIIASAALLVVGIASLTLQIALAARLVVLG